MREKWAKRIAYLTGLLVLLLSVMFAFIQNPPKVPEITDVKKQAKDIQPLEPDAIMAERIEHGLKIYTQQACALCHSIQGKGNPRYPLDHVGSLSIQELSNWVLGDDEIKGKLPERSFKLKQKHRKLTDYELESLIYYLQSLQTN